MKLVSLDRVAPQPWKNGGGRTRELLAWPRTEAWALRVSVADIDRDGPFSAFAGLDRWFTVIDGAGVVLGLPAGPTLVAAGAAPVRFDGALAPACELVDGRTVDLNLMVRHDAGHGALLPAPPDEEWFSRAAWRGVYAADACTLQIDDTDAAALRPGMLTWSDHAARQRWRLRFADPLATRAWWLEFHAQESAR